MKFKPSVKVGDYVTPKTVLGFVGRTGLATGNHVHHDGTNGKPQSWTQYRMGLSNEALRKVYFDTQPWAKIVIPHEKLFFTNKHLLHGHLGYDGNVAPEDDGLPVYSPVFGRVQYVSDISMIKQWLKGILRNVGSSYNSGFGFFVWIESDESQPTI